MGRFWYNVFVNKVFAAEWRRNGDFMEKKTFGTTLAELRRSNGLTQLDLADKLGVTDKAVSKWERDLALPEVENLIKLSDLFGVSLDVLLRGEEFAAVETVEKSAPKSEFKPEPIPERELSFPARKIVGTILLCFGVLTALLLTLLGDLLSGLIFASPFLLCGAICLAFKKRLGLMCSWAIYLSVYTYLGYATGMSLGNIFNLTWIMMTKLDGLTSQVIITWIFIAIFALLTVWTVFSFRKEPISPKKALILMISSVAVYVVIILLSAPASKLFAESQMIYSSAFRYLYRVLWSLKDFVKSSAVTVFFTSLFNLLYNRKRKN